MNRAFLTTLDNSYFDMVMFSISCEVLGSEYSVQEAYHTCQRLVDIVPSPGYGSRELLQGLSAYMARIYLWNNHFVEAANLVCDGPDDLAEWIEEGWRATAPRTAPISVTHLVGRLTCLAEALAGQGKDESADAMFQLSVFAEQRRHKSEQEHYAAEMVDVQPAYSVFLRSRGQDGDAEVVECEIDSMLKKYMLKQDHSG